MALPRVLIADGDRYAMRFLSRVLGDSYDVSLACDGREALRQLESQRFDIVLTDADLPALGGLDILRYVKATSPDTEVILVTSDGDRESPAEAAAMGAGAYECLRTAFDPEVVMRAVQRAVDHRTLCAEIERLHRELRGARGLHTSEPP